MKKYQITLLMVSLSACIYAQVGINTETPNATLDVNSKATTNAKDGLIPPKLSKQQLAEKLSTTYSTNQTGAIVYVNNVTTPTGTIPSLAQTVNITTVGYYYFDGTVWQKFNPTIATMDDSNDAWVNNPTANRVELGKTASGGTRRDNTDIIVHDNGRMGIGTGSETPDAGLHIRGEDDSWKDDIRLDSYSGGTGTPAANFRFYGSQGTVATPGNLSSGNTIGQINFHGRVGNNNTFPSLARIWSSYAGDGTTEKANLSFSASGAQNNSLVISSDQNIGISTGSPTHKLHISSGTTTAPAEGIKIVDGYQGAGKVLTSDANGVGKWSEVSLYKITGVMRAPNSAIQIYPSGTGAVTTNGTISITGNHLGQINLGSYIDLPPGKWEVEANILIDVGQPSGLNYIYNKFTFTESTAATGATVTKSSDLPPTSGSGWLIGGALTTFGHTSGDSQQYYGVVNGKVIINNTSTNTKRYYLMYYAGIRKYTDFAYADTLLGTSNNTASSSISIANVGSNTNGENYISAVKIQ